ncbi:hypothetical protein MTR_0102s0050 [Medicago truncatula]|uniref:Uncharacterized protein n=1 Tax=Medicago truncatula TaxID=3880 RepID=A0A072THN8_MEDTR|nr:hypothetical protein MTR_0102s0050 [Medicago truncatula]
MTNSSVRYGELRGATREAGDELRHSRGEDHRSRGRVMNVGSGRRRYSSSQIYQTILRNRKSQIATTIKHIYITRHKYKQSIRAPKSEMQRLMKSLVENKYLYHYRKYADSNDFRDIF